MHKTLIKIALAACSGILLAQTTIDLGRQARNVDFSHSGWTKTFKTGTQLPPACSEGETYLKLDAPAGQNIYACTSLNVWIPQGGGASAATPVFEWTRLTPTEVQISQGSFRFGARVTNLHAPGMLTLLGGTTGTIWVSAGSSGSIIIGHNLGAGNLMASGNGFVIDHLANGIPTDALPLYQCDVVGGVLPFSCQDLRATLSSSTLNAGDSGAVTVDCQSGPSCVVDLTPGVLPALASSNSFTGLNTFNQLKLPAGASPDSQQCSSVSDAGKVWVQTSGTPGRQLFVCEGVAGWRQEGSVNISTASNIGYISSLPVWSALSAQTTVGSPNQVRLILTAVPNYVRVARLATRIATTSIGGKARIGIYRADGTLVSQTVGLDTGTAVVRDAIVSPVVLEPGFYYFAWSMDNVTAKLAGSSTTTMNGLFNRVPASPGQATCAETMTASGLPTVCTLSAWPDNDSFPIAAVAAFAQ